MRSEWFNPVLPPIRRKHRIKSFGPHFSIIPQSFNLDQSFSLGIRLEWAEMTVKWFNPVLPPIRRKHRIKSFGPHFCLVVYKLISIGMSLEWGMTLKWQEWSSDTKKIDMEWRDDCGMKVVQELRVLPWLKNESHFSSFCHSVIIFIAQNGAKMARMSLEWTLSIANFHSMSFYAMENDAGMTEWGGMREFFWGEKKLNFLTLAILPSFHHSDIIRCW